MSDFLSVMEATWPSAALHRAGAFTVREGKGGGQRVSAATAESPWTEADIDTAEAMQERLGQPRLFMIRPGDDSLDAALQARGYMIKDRVNVYEAPLSDLAADHLSKMAAFTVWPPMAIMRDLWAEGGIGPGRIAVMQRVIGPKTAILGRINDRVSGVAFVAVQGEAAMLHALQISSDQRRQGSAVKMMRKAALWAQDQGAKRLFVLVTAANAPASALYASLKMRIVGHYYYRSK